MNEHAKFITIHGIDGVGKTTLVDAVNNNLRAVGRDIASESLDLSKSPWRNCREQFEKVSISERLFYKLGSKAADGNLIIERLENGITTVKDRWIIDVLADETHKGVVAPDNIYLSIVRPHLAVLLLCDEDTRMDRVQSRLEITEDDLVPCIPGERAHYFQRYLLDNLAASAEDCMILDTTDIPPEKLAESVMERIHEQ